MLHGLRHWRAHKTVRRGKRDVDQSGDTCPRAMYCEQLMQLRSYSLIRNVCQATAVAVHCSRQLLVRHGSLSAFT